MQIPRSPVEVEWYGSGHHCQAQVCYIDVALMQHVNHTLYLKSNVFQGCHISVVCLSGMLGLC